MKLEIDTKQAKVIIDALNLYVRISMGELDEISKVYKINQKVIDFLSKQEKFYDVSDDVKKAFDLQIKLRESLSFYTKDYLK
jgi:ribosomal protein S13